MTQVFISYSRKDLDFVEGLATDLKAAGLDVWYDLSGLDGGARWRIEIEKAIRASQYVIIVLSPDSIASEWVEEEILYAKNFGRKIVPLFYRQCDLPLGYQTRHYVDVQGTNYRRNFNEILQALDFFQTTSSPQVIPKKPLRTWKPQLLYAFAVIMAIFACVGMIILASWLPNFIGKWNMPPTLEESAILTVVAQTIEARKTSENSSVTLTPESVIDKPLEATPVVCDAANFIADVTVPDGAIFLPNEKFTKTWRIKNMGSCTWTSSYSLVFDKGDAMSGSATQAFSDVVVPGQAVDVSVNLIAPSSPGKYKGYWKLRNSSGEIFGVPLEYGTDGAVFVEIEVINTP
jgi:hypothetical protein